MTTLLNAAAPQSPQALRMPQALVFAALVLCAMVLTWVLTPREPMAFFSTDIQLESAIPRQFQGWHVDQTQLARVVNPQQTELLQSLYSQNLTRVYVNDKGQHMMLSISYGDKQGGGLELHRPEVCYVAQGASIAPRGISLLELAGAPKAIVLTRLAAQHRGGAEPISYWMRVGDDMMASGLSQQLSRIKHGLHGWIPDGLLFRVSSISAQPEEAYALQEQFIQALFASTPTRVHRFLVGPVSANRGAAP
jgi:EpsI family protein